MALRPPAGDGPEHLIARRNRRIGIAVQAVLVAAVLLHLVHAATGFGGPGTDAFFVGWVHSALMISAALVCVWRAAVGPRDRAAWASFAVALGTYAAGEIVWRVLYQSLEAPPYPSAADVLWLMFYPASYAGLVLLVRGRTMRFSPSLWLDGLAGGLAVATLGAAVVFQAVLSNTGGSPSAVGVTLAYPLGDLLLLGFVVAAFAVTGWRPGAAWILIGVGMAINGVADVIYLYQTAAETFVEGSIYVALFPAGALALALGAFQPAVQRHEVRLDGWRTLVMPGLFALSAVAVMAYALFSEVNPVADALALATILAVVARTGLAFREQMQAGNRVSAILDSALDSVITTDEGGRIVGFNRAAEDTFGWTRDEAMGRSLFEMVGLSRADTVLDPAGGHSRRLEATATKRDGRVFPVELALSSSRTRDEGALTVFLHDITERRRATEGLAAANQQLSERADELAAAHETALGASRLKSEFLANMSHEIRTPMNGVIGMTELLLETDLDREQTEFAQTARSSGEALLTILEDILDFSKIEAGKLELDPTDFGVREAVEDVCTLLAARAHEKALELVVSVADEVPNAVRGDQGRLRQVLVNLLGNALKFTAEGEVVVAVDVEGEGADGDVLLRFDVIDTGIGIDPSAAAGLFDPFSQADASTTRRFGGTGLGLAISRQLTELMGGELSVASEPGVGSTFTCTMRFGRLLGGEVPRPPAAAVGGVRVLVVDDNATNRRILERTLSGWGMNVLLAESARGALEALDRALDEGSPVELALLDFNMPEMDGLELVRRIRNRPTIAATPMVLLTSSGGEREAARLAGADGYMTKPVRRAALLDAMALAMVDSPEAPRGSPPLVESPDEHAIPAPLILLAEDNPVNQAVAVRLLGGRGYETVVATNGQMALEALDREDFAAILMDCQMPGLDGYEATAEIRLREGPDRRIPIIAMTANAMAGDREKCLAAGMDDYLSKPIRPRALDDMLAHWAPREAPLAAAVPESSGP